MSQLTPCPECQRHVRKTEARCPFCEAALSLAHVPSPALPRKRLGRAATFAFGASVVGATALVGCDTDPGGNVAVYGAPPSAGSGGMSSDDGGASPGGSSNGGNAGSGVAPAYGAPSAGTGPGEGGAPAAAGAGGAGGAGGEEAGGEGGGAFAVYGAPAGGDGNL